MTNFNLEARDCVVNCKNLPFDPTMMSVKEIPSELRFMIFSYLLCFTALASF